MSEGRWPGRHGGSSTRRKQSTLKTFSSVFPFPLSSYRGLSLTVANHDLSEDGDDEAGVGEPVEGRVEADHVVEDGHEEDRGHEEEGQLGQLLGDVVDVHAVHSVEVLSQENGHLRAEHLEEKNVI